MIVKLPLGNTNFREIRNEGYWYADKTSFLEDFLIAPPKASLFTRPRRFGKTLFMNMLSEFFDITKDSKNIFDGLSIAKNEQICKQWMNKYPVIFLSFKSIEGLDFNSAMSQLSFLISEWIKDNYYIDSFASDLKEDEKQLFDAYLARKATPNDLKYSLKFLIRLLYQHFGKEVIVLIDEYDVPVSKAETNGYYEEMVSFIRALLHDALKDNPMLKFVIFTGCLRIVRESIFTGLNQFYCFTIFDDEYSDVFGFTPDEVAKLLKDAGIESQMNLIKEWYDGYVFGCNSEIYCTWSVISYVRSIITSLNLAKGDSECIAKILSSPPNLYWNNSSSNDIVHKFLEIFDTGDIKANFETLANYGCIEVERNDQVTYKDLYKTKTENGKNNLWNIMYQTGYLTLAKEEQIKKSGILPKPRHLLLTIPNAEIREIYKDAIVSWFRRTVDAQDRTQLFKALWTGDANALTSLISETLLKTISYYDEHEDYYHAFMVGIFAFDNFLVKSNYESGNGRPDLYIVDDYARIAAIFEFKYLNPKDVEKSTKEAINKKLFKLANAAIEQIRSKEYESGLECNFILDKIIKYGIAFYKKSCLVLCDSTDENQKAVSATDAVPLDKGNLDYQSIGMSKEVFDTTVSNVKAIMQSTGQDVNFALDMLRISGNLRGIIKMQI